MSSYALTLLLEEALTIDPLPSSILFLKAELDSLLLALHSKAEIVAYQTHFNAAQRLEALKIRTIQSVEGNFPLILCLGQKSKNENLSLFSTGLSHLTSGGTFIVSMPNDLGAARFEKELMKMAKVEITSKSKSKCRVFSVTLQTPIKQNPKKEIRIPTQYGQLKSAPGLFAESKIDEGSQLLARYIPNDLQGHGADLGAGYGYLSSVALMQSSGITHLDLFEVEYRALECARENLKLFTHFSVFWSDVTKGIGEAKYDWIVTNPPFHQGSNQTFELGQRFIQVALQALKPGGKLFMVQNAHLPYMKMIHETQAVKKLTQGSGFVVWEVIK